MNGLGVLLYNQGDLAGARPLLERALALQKALQGELHPDYILGLNNLAVLLLKQTDLRGARTSSSKH